MPEKYKYQLVDGKFLTLEGDTPPTDEEVESLAKEQGVELQPVSIPESKVEAAPVEPIVNVPTNIPKEVPVEQPPSMISKAWHAISDPLTTAPSEFARSISANIDAPSLETSPMMARIKGFGRGAVEGIGDLMSGMTSPINLATMAATGGAVKGIPGMANAVKALSAPVAAHGAYQTFNPESTMGERGMGLAEMAGGIAGMRSHIPVIGESIKSGDIPTNIGAPFPERPPIDEAGRVLGPPEKNIARPAGPWDTNTAPTAEFLGLQENGQPLFNVKGGPSDGSTVSSQKLRELGIKAPKIPEDAVPMKGEQLREIALDKQKSSQEQINDAIRKDWFANASQKIREGKDIVTPEVTQVPTQEVGSVIKIESNKATPQQVKKAREQGYEFDGLNKDGSFNFRKTSEGSPQPVLESELGNIRPRGQVGPLADVKKSSITAEAFNFPRAVMASFDMSAPLRQGLGLIHKPEFWKALPSMVKSFGSENFFRGVQQSIAEKPLFKPRIGPNNTTLPSFAEDAGLKLTDLTDLTSREEALMSTWAEKIPGIRMSNRAYTSFLNKLRADTFESLINQGKVIGVDGKTNIPLARGLADFVNTATGRGSLGKLESSAVALNSTFFSPRLIASRLRMLNPNYYIMANPMVRKEALKSLFAVAAVGNTVGQLVKHSGYGTVESDATSSDFGKIKIGNTRIDPFAGFQQYIVAANRLIQGRTKSTTTGNEYKLGEKFGRPTRLDVVGRLGESKLNPVLSFATGILRGKDFTGAPFNIPEEVASRFTPIFLQDVKQLATEDSHLLSGYPEEIGGEGEFHPENLPMTIPSFFGAGVQNYESR